MRQLTNLAWPTTPFGADQRPFGRSRPTLAAITITAGPTGIPTDAALVYLRIDSTRAIELAPSRHLLHFGYELVVLQDAEPADALVRMVDARLVACRREAKYLAGHRLAADLRLLAQHAQGARRTPGLDGVVDLCNDPTRKGRGTARMVDTANDGTGSCGGDLDEACVSARLHTHYATVSTTRGTLTRALAVALIAAGITGRYTWSRMLDLDTLVAGAAWDQFTCIERE